jgi:UDP-GlcNAc:undecaprenyl-phosphate GlcNAc-1-phosphate transferase
VLGIVAIVNVINLTDGVDGLAAGVCVISAASLAVIALSLDRNTAGVLAALTAGGALGFLRHGFPPASSFMGDTGSNLLGYLLGCIAIQGALKTSAVAALFFPLVVLAVPIFDTGFVVAKRLKYRRPIYEADTWHLHHRMANLGFSQRRTLAYLYAWTLIMAGLGLALRFIPYSDDRGNFDTGWTIVIVACFAVALAASVYLVVVLEILKLRGVRSRQLATALSGAPPAPAEVDEGVARELETGSFEALDPQTGEYRHLDPETGEFEAVPPPDSS